jgi:hypothetical protein
MSSESTQMSILRDQLNEANATIEFLRSELWSRAQDIWEAHDCLYYAMVLLAFCDACKNGSLSVLKDRFQETESVRELVDALKDIDEQNSLLLKDAGVSLERWH